MGLESYSIFGATDKGLLRERNEDAFLINLENKLFAIADGLGGLPAGDLASKLAINTLDTTSSQEPIDFKTTFKNINKIINTTGNTINKEFGIGTTLTAIQFLENKISCGHVGDSGLFLFTKTEWLKLTKDDTMAEDIKDNVGSLNDHSSIPDYYNHVLTQCIGKNDNLDVQTFNYSFSSNNRFLLYTDGVTKAFSPSELHLLAFQSNTAEEFVKTIINQANSRGGIDNITAIAIFT